MESLSATVSQDEVIRYLVVEGADDGDLDSSCCEGATESNVALLLSTDYYVKILIIRSKLVCFNHELLTSARIVLLP